MLVFPHWRPEIVEGCRTRQWLPTERLASYFARQVALPQPSKQEDDYPSGGSSPISSDGSGEEICEWQGCGARLGNVTKLSAHVARAHAHAHQDGLFYCAWKDCCRCQRGFNARYKMLVHVRTHTNERPHICKQCNKSFCRAENLKIHMRTHSGEKPYVCPYEGCGKAYTNSSDRFKHTRTHTVDKPYCCKVPGCNKRYTDPSSLRKHVKTYRHFTPKDNYGNVKTNDIHNTASNFPAISQALNPKSTNCEYSNQKSAFSPISTSLPQQVPQVNTNMSNYDYPNFNPTYSHHNPKLCLSTISQSYNPVIQDSSVPTTCSYTSCIERLSYSRPLEPLYQLRVPQHEMSYLEYTRMYEHAYKKYYSTPITYLNTSEILDQRYNLAPNTNYKESHLVVTENRSNLKRRSPVSIDQEMPLNLKKCFEFKPITDLIRKSDIPLDLSTKS